MEGKAIGIGGFFMKFENPGEMNAWYTNVLGLKSNDYGVLFDLNNQKGFMQLGTFESSSKYFGNDSQRYMINFKVDNMVKLKARLEEQNVKILDEIEEFDYGSFLHIEDPEGNRIELWEEKESNFGEENHQ